MARFEKKFDTSELMTIGVSGARAVERYICSFDTKVEAIGNPFDVAFARKPRGTLHSNTQLAALGVQVQQIEVTITSAPEVFYVDVIYGQPDTILFSGLWSFAKIGALEQEVYAVDANGKQVGGNVYWSLGDQGVSDTPITLPDGTTRFFAKVPRVTTIRRVDLVRMRPVGQFVLRGENLVAMSHAISGVDYYKVGTNTNPFYGYPPGTVRLAHDAWESVQQTVGPPGGITRGVPSGSLPATGVFNVELVFETDVRGWDQTIADTLPLKDSQGVVHEVVVPGSEETFQPYPRLDYSGLLQMFAGTLVDRPLGIVGP